MAAAIAAGIAAGALGCLVFALPVLLTHEDQQDDIARGLAGVVGSFLAIAAATFAARQLWPERTVAFGATAALVFLAGATAFSIVRSKR